MSTIPTTLDQGGAPYTVVGCAKGGPCPESMPVSVLLLNRGSRLYRSEAFRELERIGFRSIVSVEAGGGEGSDVEGLVSRHPRARFLLLSEPASPGEMINLGMRESCGPYVFVLWNDLKLLTQALSSRFFERLAEEDILCQAPTISSAGELVPSASSPALEKGASLKVLNLAPGVDGTKSLYPFDFCGIYSRERFVMTGGFDGGIANPYWQKLDFGFRSWLWGEEIRVLSALKLAYGGSPPSEDATPDSGYARFWLKNLAPAFRADSAHLPASRFWPYLKRSAGGPFAAIAEFRAAREWIALNRFRFKSDAADLADLWEGGAE